jgi:iduronate 2-sulfatase
MRNQHFFLFCLLLTLAACAKKVGSTVTETATTTTTTSTPMPQGKAKNILFIAIDDLKPLLNCYGSKQMKTPNFDRLAAMGTMFTNAQVQQAVCGPSRASIMTATYPDRTKVWDLETDFRVSAPDLISMPEYLISQGYETVATGKIYHKGSASPGHDGKSWTMPSNKENFAYPAAYGEPAFSFYQDPTTKAVYEKLNQDGKKVGREKAFKKLKPSTEGADVPNEAYQDAQYTLATIEHMKKLAKGTKPFFLAIGYQRPHLPFVAPKKYWDLYDRTKINLAEFRKRTPGVPDIAWHNSGELASYTDVTSSILDAGEDLPEAEQRRLIHGYMAAISFIDAELGKLLDALEAQKLSENTVIVLWGDHGFHLGDHALWCKHSNFEQATRIPFMFAGPGVAKGKKVAQPVELVSAFPTLFDLVGVKQPAQAQGISIAPLLDNSDKTNISRDFAVSQFPRRKTVMGYSVRTDKFRYTEWRDAGKVIGSELYNYETDPNETKNLAEEKAQQGTIKDLQGKLNQHLAAIK